MRSRSVRTHHPEGVFRKALRLCMVSLRIALRRLLRPSLSMSAAWNRAGRKPGSGVRRPPRWICGLVERALMDRCWMTRAAGWKRENRAMRFLGFAAGRLEPLVPLR